MTRRTVAPAQADKLYTQACGRAPRQVQGARTGPRGAPRNAAWHASETLVARLRAAGRRLSHSVAPRSRGVLAQRQRTVCWLLGAARRESRPSSVSAAARARERRRAPLDRRCRSTAAPPACRAATRAHAPRPANRRNHGRRGRHRLDLAPARRRPGRPRSLRARDPPSPPPAASAHAAVGAVLKEAPPACSVRHWRPPIEPAARRRFRGGRALSDAASELGHGRRQPPAPADEVAGRAAQSARLRTAAGLESGGELQIGEAS